jgi:hypothetical protein
MTTATQINSWISVRGGKWHRATVAEPAWARQLPNGRWDFDHKETSACGLTFTPVNVTVDAFPYAADMPQHIVRLHLCRHCYDA